jgi:hypothetical protein
MLTCIIRDIVRVAIITKAIFSQTERISCIVRNVIQWVVHLGVIGVMNVMGLMTTTLILLQIVQKRRFHVTLRGSQTQTQFQTQTQSRTSFIFL